MSYTPGPWEAYQSKTRIKIDDEYRWSEKWRVNGPPSKFGWSEADARLIAAAPEMVALLERMDAAWDKPDGPFLLAISAVHKESQQLLARIKGDQ